MKRTEPSHNSICAPPVCHEYIPAPRKLEQLIARADLPRDQRDGLAALLVRAEQEAADLRASKAEIESVLQTTVDGVITIDQEGTVHSFNPAAERIFGYTATEVMGHNVNMLQPEPYHSHHDEYVRNYLRTRDFKIFGYYRVLLGLIVLAYFAWAGATG